MKHVVYYCDEPGCEAAVELRADLPQAGAALEGWAESAAGDRHYCLLHAE